MSRVPQGGYIEASSGRIIQQPDLEAESFVLREGQLGPWKLFLPQVNEVESTGLLKSIVLISLLKRAAESVVMHLVPGPGFLLVLIRFCRYFYLCTENGTYCISICVFYSVVGTKEIQGQHHQRRYVPLSKAGLASKLLAWFSF